MSLKLCNDIKEITECWLGCKLYFANSISEINNKCLPAITFREISTEDITSVNGTDYEEITYQIDLFDRCPSGCAAVKDLDKEFKQRLNDHKNKLRQFYKILTGSEYKYKYEKSAGINRRRITCHINKQTEHGLMAVKMRVKVVDCIPKNCCPQTDYDVKKLMGKKFGNY